MSSPLITAWVKSLIFWGFYEKPEITFVHKYLVDSVDIVELGASIGVVTSHIAVRVGHGRRLVSVEADPRLAECIRRNVALNAPDANVTLVNGAISYDTPEGSHVDIRFGSTNLSGQLQGGAGGSSAQVPALRLSSLCKSHGIARFVLISDIEGAEAGMISSDDDALKMCDLIVIELHATEVDGVPVSIADQVAMLEQKHGFRLMESRKSVYVFARATANSGLGAQSA